MADRFDDLANRVQLDLESYALRGSIDGRKRVIREALIAAHATGKDEADDALRRGMSQMRLLAGLPLPVEVADEITRLRARNDRGALVIEIRVGAVQAAALDVYVLDPAHGIDPESRAFSLDGSTLRVDLDALDLDAACSYLVQASNSADASNDREFRDALHALARRLRVMCLRADLARVTAERNGAIEQLLATQSQAARTVLDATARLEAAERERDEARALLVQRGMEIDALVSEKRDAVEAFHDATRLRSQIQAARVKAEDERDAAIARAEAAERREASALSGEADAVRRAESAELGCEIAYRREPTQAEGDAHESDHGCDCCEDDCQRCAHLAPLAIKSGECFVPMGGWTGRRCRRCRRWTWGGPAACDACAAFESGQERAEAAERERDALSLEVRQLRTNLYLARLERDAARKNKRAGGAR